MKVLLHYEDNTDNNLWKTLKITLPKSWKNGPTSKLLAQFIESYNSNATLGASNPLTESNMHLSTRKKQSDGTTQLVSLANDEIILDCLVDRADVYVCHGASESLADRRAAASQQTAADTVQCKRFGCQKRFLPGLASSSGPCLHHKAPPVFHETAKFWSCCPQKKAYDWDDFQAIPGCCESECCTEEKENQQERQFLGGMDLREQAAANAGLKSIDDFNKEQSGNLGACKLEKLKTVLADMDIDKELFDQVVGGIKKGLLGDGMSEAEADEAAAMELSQVIKTALKNKAASQLRIK